MKSYMQYQLNWIFLLSQRGYNCPSSTTFEVDPPIRYWLIGWFLPYHLRRLRLGGPWWGGFQFRAVPCKPYSTICYSPTVHSLTTLKNALRGTKHVSKPGLSQAWCAPPIPPRRWQRVWAKIIKNRRARILCILRGSSRTYGWAALNSECYSENKHVLFHCREAMHVQFEWVFWTSARF